MRKPKLILPQPQVFKEVDAMRMKMRRKAQKLGWEQYLAGINERAGQLLGKPPAPSPATRHRSPKQGLRSFGRMPDNQSTRRTVSARTS